MRTALPLFAAALVVACSSDKLTGPRQTARFDEVGSEAIVTYRINLLQSEEVPTANPTGAYGEATVTVNTDLDQVTVQTTLWNPLCEIIQAGHIHQGPRGVAAPIVVPLFSGRIQQPFIQFDPVTVNISHELALHIANFPQFFYVNYHSVHNPGGTARGQLDGTFSSNPPALPHQCQ